MTCLRQGLAVLGVVALGQAGCGRIYTMSPESAARLHDDHWTTVRERAPATPELAAPPQPIVPLRERPEVVAALRSTPDGFGIPTELYALDPLLDAQRAEVIARRSSARSTANSLFIVAGTELALSALCWWAAPYSASKSSDPDQKSTRKFLFIGWAVVLDLSAIWPFASAIDLQAPPSSAALRRYFGETYAPPLAP